MNDLEALYLREEKPREIKIKNAQRKHKLDLQDGPRFRQTKKTRLSLPN